LVLHLHELKLVVRLLDLVSGLLLLEVKRPLLLLLLLFLEVLLPHHLQAVEDVFRNSVLVEDFLLPVDHILYDSLVEVVRLFLVLCALLILLSDGRVVVIELLALVGAVAIVH